MIETIPLSLLEKPLLRGPSVSYWDHDCRHVIQVEKKKNVWLGIVTPQNSMNFILCSSLSMPVLSNMVATIHYMKLKI